MRIEKENIHEVKVKCKNTLQITLDDDFNVPDMKADIDMIVKEWGNIRVDNVKNNIDKAEVSGCLEFALLYTGFDSAFQKIVPVKMSGSMNFNETVNLSLNCDSSYIVCDAKLEDITVKAINTRKISVKAIISLTVVAEDMSDISIGCDVSDIEDNDQVKILSKDVSYSQLAVNIRDNLRIKENVSLNSGKPEIAEIIWQDIDVRNLNSRLTDEGINLNGELGIFLMYLPNCENPTPQMFESQVAFEGKLDVNGCDADMIGIVKYNIISSAIEAKPNYDGENMDLAVEVVLDLALKAYADMEKTVIADMYSPVKNVIPKKEDVAIRKLLVHNASKCKTTDRIKLKDYDNVLQVLNCTGMAQVDDIEVEEDGLQVYGAIVVNVFYITSNDNSPMGSIRTALPFSNKIQIKTDENMEFTVEPYVEQIVAVMTGGDEIEIKGTVCLETTVFESETISVVNDCEIEEFKENEFLNFPSIIGYIANGEDTLWDIAKNYHTTCECIRRQNPVVSDKLNDDMKIKRGEKLLLVKAVK